MKGYEKVKFWKRDKSQAKRKRRAKVYETARRRVKKAEKRKAMDLELREDDIL